MKAYGHILKYTGLFGGAQVFYILMSIVRNKFTAIFIGTFGLGVIDLYCRTIDLLGNATSFGIGFSAVRRLSELEERGEKKAVEQYVKLIRSWTLLLALLGMVLCVALAPLICRAMVGSGTSPKGFMALAPMVGIGTLTMGEMAVLKGLKKLRRIAAITALGSVTTMLITVATYAWLGVHGILPVLLLTTGALLLLTLRASTRDFPYRLGLRSRKLLRGGMHLLRLGSAYVLAGVAASLAEMAVRAFLVDNADIREVGLYSVGLTLVVSYSRLIFVSMDADFYPRLAAAAHDVAGRNELINRQIDVLVLLMAPFLIVFALFLPLIIRLLYTEQFLEAAPMVLCALPYMFFKAVYSPVAYLSLARGDSLVYLVMETLYNAVFVGCVMTGYHYLGLVGAGLGLTAANVFDFASLSLVYRRHYRMRYERGTLQRCGVQLLLLAGGLAAAAQPGMMLKAGAGAAAAALSVAFSWRTLRRDENITAKFAALRKRLNGRTRKTEQSTTE